MAEKKILNRYIVMDENLEVLNNGDCIFAASPAEAITHVLADDQSDFASKEELRVFVQVGVATIDVPLPSPRFTFTLKESSK